MPRRGHGEGNIRKRPDGRWEARVSTPQGRRSFYGKTRMEVARKMSIALGELEKGEFIPASKIRLDEFLEDWLENTARLKVKASTYVTYRNRQEQHLIPLLGHIRLTDLEPRQVQAALANLEDSDLAPSSINAIRAQLRNALNQAVVWGMINRNPVDGTVRVREPRRNESPWTPEQARTFLTSLEGDRLEALFYLAISVGLRRGELVALRWSDLDLAAGTATVAQSAQWVDGEMLILEPKTRASGRTLRLPDEAVRLLREHAKRKPKGEHVFITSSGGPIHPANLWEMFKYRTKRAGLPEIRFHDLRHICATFLLRQGVDIKVVSEILGHASVATTADIYAHVLPNLQDEAAQKMQNLLSSRETD